MGMYPMNWTESHEQLTREMRRLEVCLTNLSSENCELRSKYHALTIEYQHVKRDLAAALRWQERHGGWRQWFRSLFRVLHQG